LREGVKFVVSWGMHPGTRRKEKLKPVLERDRKRFLAPGWRFVTLEGMDRLCMAHRRSMRRTMFFGRRVTMIQDSTCKLRAVIRRSRRLPAEVTEP